MATDDKKEEKLPWGTFAIGVAVFIAGVYLILPKEKKRTR